MNTKELIFIIVIITSISLFYLGFHNTDLGYNFKGGTDCNGFRCVSTEKLYSEGLTEMQISFYILLILSVITIFLNNKKH